MAPVDKESEVEEEKGQDESEARFLEAPDLIPRYLPI